MTNFNQDDFFADFFTKGFYCFSAKDVLAHVVIDCFEQVGVKHPDNCFHAEGHEFHNFLMAANIGWLKETIRRVYLPKMKAELSFDFYSDKCNDHVVNFHSDAQYSMPNQNATINCFFDDTNEEVGGRFDMAPYRDTTFGSSGDVADMHSVYPKKYDIIIFNQNRNFLHKVIPSSERRRMVSFACTFLEFNPLHPNWVPG